jgi:hypothetical protein
MTPFQFIYYYLNNERKIDILENSFVNINEKIELYEKQYTITLNSYLKLWDKELILLESQFKKGEEFRKKIYAENLGTENLQDENNIAYATNISGMEYYAEKHTEDKQKIKLKYFDFLDLYSKSTLIALYSLNENFLNETCDISSEILNKKIKISHFNSRNYLKATIEYLQLVIDIEITDLEKYISKLKDIQYLRNKIIHAGSKFTDDYVLKIVKKYSDSLHYEKEILKIIKPDFVKDLFKVLKEFYEETLWLLEERNKFEIIRKIFENWFGVIGERIIISEINYKRRSEKVRTITFIVNSEKGKIKDINAKLTLTRNKGYDVDIKNQSENNLIKEFTEAQMETKGFYLEKELKVFLQFDKRLDIELIIY